MNLEVEFKYNADSISLGDFNLFCKNKDYIKYLVIHGKDDFYGNKHSEDDFYRHRVNDKEQELTYKKQLNKENNYVRVEHNIPLSADAKKETISNFLNYQGYEYVGTILKTSHIYNFDYYTLAYYVCFDEDWKELGRFIEIEAKEDFDWSSEQEAKAAIETVEKLMRSIGISKSKRESLSLYQMFIRSK